MKWSPQQDAALRDVKRWLRNSDRQVYCLAGYAGTGKTTLAKHFAEGLDGRVAFVAFTGKAAHVLRRKGCADASTIHNLIYRLVGENDKKLEFELNHTSRARDLRLIVADECSMVDEQMARDLLSFRIPVLVLMDPAQLPPINNGGYFTDVKPDFLLTEIHRQALDNPIIAMATTVREGGRLEYGSYGDSRVVNIGSPEFDSMAADQILVGTNRKRRTINSGIRSERLKYRGAYPVKGDKLVCLRNDYAEGLLNGSLWRVIADPKRHRDDLLIDLVDDDGEGEKRTVMTHAGYFDGCRIENQFQEYLELDYGYALTVHKAQGSEWHNVLLHDDSRYFGIDAARWLYTGITRAARQITIVVREQ
jgi:exodeoxyribonuclease-5